MKTSLYIFQPCILARKDNTLSITVLNEKEEVELHPGERLGKEEAEFLSLYEEDAWWQGTPKMIPIERIEDILCFSAVRLNSSLIHFLAKKGVSLHFFDYYGKYTSSLVNEAPNQNGRILFAQVFHYQNDEKRLAIAKSFIKGAVHNMNRLLKYYQRRNEEIPLELLSVPFINEQIDKSDSLNVLMGVEGNTRKKFYSELDRLLLLNLRILERTYNPPSNPANALLSFLNTLLYSAVFQEIRKTALNPTIGFLHEVGRQKYPLVYDITEIFRPLLSEQLLLSLIRKRIIKEEDFDPSMNGGILKKDGRYKVARGFEQRMRSTIMHPTLKRKVSYRSLIRLEVYKLIKHITNQKKYEPLTIHW